MNVEGVVEMVLDATAHRDAPLNERQAKLINRLLDGFDGKLTSSTGYELNGALVQGRLAEPSARGRAPSGWRWAWPTPTCR